MKGGIIMYNRIRELRELNNLTQNECAKKVYVSKNSYIRYESGERMIPLDIAVLLAQLYNVSVDYIANATDETTPYKKREGKI